MRLMKKCLVAVLCVSMLLSQTVVLAGACDVDSADTQTVIGQTDTTNAVQPAAPADEGETAADADALLLSEDVGETASAATDETDAAEDVESEQPMVTLLADESTDGWPGATANFALKDPTAVPSADNPFVINSAAKLAKLAQLVNAGSTFVGEDDATYSYAQVYYQLTADVDLEGSGWTPIGTVDNPFQGYFDGNGYNITNFYIEGVQAYVGLFGVVSGGELKNMNVTGTINSNHTDDKTNRYMGVIGYAENAVLTGLTVDITVQHYTDEFPEEIAWIYAFYFGAVAGKTSETVASNLTVKANIDVAYYSVNNTYIGGAFGYMDSNSTFTDSTVEIDLDPTFVMTEKVSARVGGAVSYIDTSAISGVTVTGTMKAKAPGYLGGVVAHAVDATLTDCVNKAAITAEGIVSGTDYCYRGGVLGYAGKNCVLKGLTNAGSMDFNVNYNSTSVYAGGILGRAYGNYVALTDCVNDGDITATVTVTTSKSVILGGVTGNIYYYGTVAWCRNNGAVTIQNAEGVAGSYNAYLGGVIGTGNSSTSYPPEALTNLVNTGTVTLNSATTGIAEVGGIMAQGDASGLRNSINTGAVSVTSAGTVYAAGLLGYANGTIVNSVNAGAVSAATAEGKTCEAYQLAGYRYTYVTSLAENSFYAAGDMAPAAEDEYLTGVGVLNTDGTVTFSEGSTGLYPTLTSAKAMLNQYLLEHADGYSALWMTEEESGATLPIGAVLTPAAEPTVTMSQDVTTTVGGEAAVTASVSVPKNATGDTALTYQWYSGFLGDTTVCEKVDGASGTVALTGDETLTGTVTLNVPTEEGGKTFYYLEVTNNVTNTLDDQSGTCTAAVNSGFVSVVVNGTDGKYYGEVATAFAGGSGIEDDPYLIANEAQLAYLYQVLSTKTQYQKYSYVLTEDLDFNGQVFLPMASFAGTFDGGGHTISNLRIVSLNSGYSGFFRGLSSSGIVKDLTLEGGVLELPGSATYIGTVAGYMGTRATISNVHSSMKIDCPEVSAGASYYIGGLVGAMNGTTLISPVVTECVIEDSTYSGSIDMPSGIMNVCYIGGIVGKQDGAYALAASEFGNTIRNCYNTGDITVGNLISGNTTVSLGTYVGGVVGYCYGSVLNCANLGTITADHADEKYYVSGLAGYMLTGSGIGGNANTNDTGAVRNCVNYGKLTVTGEVTKNYLNGIAYVSTGSAVVADSYSVPIDNENATIVYAPNTIQQTGIVSTSTLASSSTGAGVLDTQDGSLTPAVNAGTDSSFILNYPLPSILEGKYTDLYYALNNGASYTAEQGARGWQAYDEGGVILVPTGEVKANPLGDFTADADGSYQKLIAGELEEISVADKIFDYNYGAAEDEYAPVLTVNISGVDEENTCYQWYRVTSDGLTETTTLIEGATGKSYTPDMTLPGAVQYYAQVVAVQDYFGATRITNSVTVSVQSADGKWVGNVASKDSLEGNGTEDDPFLIPDAETLALMAQLVNTKAIYPSVADDGTTSDLYYKDACWKLTADIDLGGTYYWTSIGTIDGAWIATASFATSSAVFGGRLDGAGHTISGMKTFITAISSTTQTVSPTVGGGLFAGLGGAEVYDLTISGAQVTTENTGAIFRVGLLAGLVYDGANIHNVTVKDSTLNLYETKGSGFSYYGQYVGGLVGYNVKPGLSFQTTYNANATIDSCDVDVDINIDVLITTAGDPGSSGMGGPGSSQSLADNTEYNGLPGVYAGGIAGNFTMPITNCTFSGTINGKSASKPTIWMGGIVGTGTTLINDVVTGTLTTTLTSVNGASRMGGLAYSINSNGIVENCYSTAALELIVEEGYEGTREASLLVNTLSTGAKVLNCYADSTVTGASTVGVTTLSGSGAENCFYRVSAAGAALSGTDVAGNTAITTAEALVNSLNAWVYENYQTDSTTTPGYLVQTWTAGESVPAVFNGLPTYSSLTVGEGSYTAVLEEGYTADEETGAYTVMNGKSFTFTVASTDSNYAVGKVAVGDQVLTPNADGSYTAAITEDTVITVTLRRIIWTSRTEANTDIEKIITSVAAGTNGKPEEPEAETDYDDTLDYNDDEKNDLLDILDILYRLKDQDIQSVSADGE